MNIYKTSLFMLGVSSNGKWSHNIAAQSTGGSGRGEGRQGGGGRPQGGKVKQESLAWFPLKELARPEVSELKVIPVKPSGTSGTG